MLMTMRASSKKLHDGLQVESSARNFRIIMDEPKQMGGTDAGMNPIEAMLCALGSCQVIVAGAFAKAHGFSFDELRIDLEGDLDPTGFRGTSDARKGLQEIRYSVHFKTNESQEKAEAFAEFMEATCPVGDSIMNGVKIVRSGVVLE